MPTDYHEPMYLEHFNLAEYPFGLTPNTRFFCALSTHQEALNVLSVSLHSGEGFIKITGEVGTGKTLLCRKLLNELDDSFVTAYIPNPVLTQEELFLAIADELGISRSKRLKSGELLRLINLHLLEIAAADKHLVLVLDEVQAMPVKSLESLRLLTNLETESRKLLQIVLFGQPELDELLTRDDLRQLRQRITFSYRLSLLNRAQTRLYLFNRLRVAGCLQRDLLTWPAYELIYAYSKGTPRLLNILAHKALMAAFGQGSKRVSFKHVHAAASDTEGISRISFMKPLWITGLLFMAFWGVKQIMEFLP